MDANRTDSQSVVRRWWAKHRRELVPPSLKLAASFFLLFVLHFQIMRVLLLWKNSNLTEDVANADLFSAFVAGLRFDVATTSYLLLVLLPLLWFLDWRRGYAVSRKAALVVTSLGLAIITLLGLGELEFYREYFSRFNSLAIVYWEQPETVLSAIWHGFPVVVYLLATVAMVVIPMFVVAKLSRMRGPAEHYERRSPTWLQATSGVVVVLMLFVGARGGIRGVPLDWGDAVHSDSTFANHLAQNGVWSLGRSLIAVWEKEDPLPNIWPEALPPEDAAKRMQELLAYELGNPSTRADRSQATPPVLETASGNPPNVVLIIMESFSARFCGACGADKSDDDYTPEFNQLAAQGVLFDRCFSAGSHTHQANYATVCGVPNLPGHEYLMNDPALGAQPFDSLPRAFKARGYQTMYLYNGELSWENMEGFFRGQGIDHFVQRSDFGSDSQFDSTWGVTDEELFKRVNKELAAAQGPFFATICTMSNHEPFDLPQPLPFPEVQDQGSMNKWFNGIRYADWALGQFFAQARKEEYFKDTLFVLVGDHGFSVAPILTDLRLLRFHVPLLFYAPEMLESNGRVDSRIASHLDILPTVLSLVGDGGPHKVWGKNLLGLQEDAAGWAYFKPSEFGEQIGFAQGNRLLVKAGQGRTRLYEFDLGFPASVREITNEAERLREMDQTLEAYVETAARALKTRDMIDERNTVSR